MGQTKKRNKKFLRELEKNDSKLKKAKRGKALGTYISREGCIISKGIIQKSLDEIKNQFITGLGGCFILESSVEKSQRKFLSCIKTRISY